MPCNSEMVEFSVIIRVHVRTGTGSFSVLSQTILGTSFFSSSFNGRAETLKSGGWPRLSGLLVGLSRRWKQSAIAAQPVLCPELQQHCTVSCQWHVTASSECVSSLTGTSRVTPPSNTTLWGSLCLSRTAKKGLVARSQDRHLVGFLSVVTCSCSGEAPPQASVKCHSWFRCDCEHGAVHKTQTCHLNCGTPEQCPPLNVIALSDK